MAAVVVSLNLVSLASAHFEFIHSFGMHLTVGPIDFHMGQLTEAAALLFLAILMSRKMSFPVTCFAMAPCLILIGAVFFIYPDDMHMSIVYAIAFILLLVNNPTFSGMDGSFSAPNTSGYAIIQSIYAIADGGFFGVGFGKGTMR